MSSRPIFDAEMRELEIDVAAMASRAEQMVANAIESLIRIDSPLAQSVFDDDDVVDEYEHSIEERCLRMLALQQPMAADLREVFSILKIITEIERIGDLAVDLGRICLKIDREVGDSSIIDLGVIGNRARQTFRQAVTAFVKRDTSEFGEIAQHEQEVDQYYRAIREQVFDHVRRNPSHAVSSTWLVLALHHIERIADHSVNIAELVGFMVTGKPSSISPNQQD